MYLAIIGVGAAEFSNSVGANCGLLIQVLDGDDLFEWLSLLAASFLALGLLGLDVLLSLLFALSFSLFFLLVFFVGDRLGRSWLDEIYNRYLRGLRAAPAGLARAEPAHALPERHFRGGISCSSKATGLSDSRRGRPERRWSRQRIALLVVDFAVGRLPSRLCLRTELSCLLHCY